MPRAEPLAAANPSIRSLEAAALHAVALFEDDVDKLEMATTQPQLKAFALRLDRTCLP